MSFAEKFVRRPQNLWLRRALFQIHLWTGIALGLYIVAISVSGSALFFRNMINAAAGRKIVAGSGRLLTRNELIEAAQRAYPGYTADSVYQGRQAGQEVEITLIQGTNKKRRIFDPYTGRDLGNAVPYSVRMISFMLELHVNLLAGSTGRVVNGIVSIFCTLLAVTGAVIWWPGIKNWRRSLTINPRANWKRLNWELHSAVGFWTFAFFFMWSFTGIYLVFPNPFNAVLDKIAPLDFYRLASSESEPVLKGGEAGPAAVFVRVADTGTAGPAAGPAPSTPGPPMRRPRRKIHYSFGDQIVRTFFGAHFGNFAGLKTRILWAAIGLAPPFLFVTGVVMWWNRVLNKEGRGQ